MADIIPLTMGTRDIQATDGEAITAVEVAECSAAVSLEGATAVEECTEGCTGAVAINIDSAKGWTAAKQ
jgi:hypothetical protein